MAITVSELARQLGVSHVTVSHALRGSGRMAATTRARILAAAEATGCLPQAAASAMRQGRTGAVTLLYGHGYDRRLIPVELIDGLLTVLAPAEVRLQIAHIPGDVPGPDALPGRMRAWSSDGLLVNFAERIPDTLADQIARHRLPTIYLNARRPQGAVIPDDAGIGQLAAQQLLVHGHRTGVWLDLTYGEDEMHRAHSSATARAQAAVAAFSASGGTCTIIRRGVDQDDRVQAARAAVLAHPQATAWMVASPSTAAPLLIALAGLGLTVPGDRSVVGIGERPIAGYGPTLDTVIVPFQGLGAAAATALVALIAGQEPGPTVVVAGQLVAGQSVRQR